MSSFPELFYVNSKITDPALTPELFTKWYNEEHIPDILSTSGIKEAYRFEKVRGGNRDDHRPYLALYPVNRVGYLQTQEFAEIPVKSDMLPGQSHEIFDCANFDARCYKVVAEKVNGHVADDSSPFVATLQFEDAAWLNGNIDDYVNKTGSSPSSRLMELYFSRENRLAPEESSIGQPPTYLGVHNFASEQEVVEFEQKMAGAGQIAVFRLLKRFE